jgi:uncharacterized protein (DUF2267 family)
MKDLEKSKRNTHRAMNFEQYAAEGVRFINEVAQELNVGYDSAARITRAVLHAVRDRIPADDAIEFAQGLPMAIKGIYIDRYDISNVPVAIRNPDEFIYFVRYKAGRSSRFDFPDHDSVEDGIAAVFRVLERNMDYGQVEQIKHMMNDEIAYMFY